MGGEERFRSLRVQGGPLGQGVVRRALGRRRDRCGRVAEQREGWKRQRSRKVARCARRMIDRSRASTLRRERPRNAGESSQMSQGAARERSRTQRLDRGRPGCQGSAVPSGVKRRSGANNRPCRRAADRSSSRGARRAIDLARKRSIRSLGDGARVGSGGARGHERPSRFHEAPSRGYCVFASSSPLGPHALGERDEIGHGARLLPRWSTDVEGHRDAELAAPPRRPRACRRDSRAPRSTAPRRVVSEWRDAGYRGPRRGAARGARARGTPLVMESLCTGRARGEAATELFHSSSTSGSPAREVHLQEPQRDGLGRARASTGRRVELVSVSLSSASGFEQCRHESGQRMTLGDERCTASGAGRARSGAGTPPSSTSTRGSESERRNVRTAIRNCAALGARERRVQLFGRARAT